MRRPICLLLFILSAIFLHSQDIKVDTFYSQQVKDKFVITIRKPAGFTLSKNYHHVYIVDGSIGIGDYILGKSDSWKATIPPNCVIIAIAHTGNWHEKRNRDFVPSDLRKNSTTSFGNADKFYAFLKTELFPVIEKKLPNKKDRAFIGHSLGGLFCLYTLFKDDVLFDYHFAISPSIWANNYEIDKIEANYFTRHTQLKARVKLYAGGLEFLNKVLYPTRGFYSTMIKRKYKGLTIEKKEYADANHFSVRKPAVGNAFEALKK